MVLLVVVKSDPFKCSRCNSDSTAGTRIRGYGHETHRVYECPNCGHVDLQEIPDPAAEQPHEAEVTEATPEGEPEPNAS